MKASKGICTWHTFMCATVVGALALAVSVQGSPRAGERGKTDGKSAVTRLVTGPSTHINDAIAAGSGATISLTPVAPKTVPSTPINGTIAGQTQTLATVPTRAWFEVHVTGWAPQNLKTLQAKVDSDGYLGSSATCGSGLGNGGNLTPAMQACNVNADCRAPISGITSSCATGEPSKCLTWDGVNPNYFPAGKFCEPGFQDKCDPEWGLNGVAGVGAVDISVLSYRYGFTAEPPDVAQEFNPSYAGTLVLDVPANAKGTYTIGFVAAESFMFDDTQPQSLPIVVTLIPGVLKIGCGSCCFGVGTAAPGCADGLSAAECGALAQPAIFTADGTCLAPPTDAGCCACLTNADCNDGDACTNDICNNCVCSNTAKGTWDQVNECCDATTGVETALGCADQCQAASCSVAPNRGSAICTDTPGATCNDQNPCTYNDTCAAGAGSCAGLDANAVACVDSAECAAATGVGYPCIDGFCNCTLTPDLDIDIIDLGENCFDTGEKVLACAHIAASSSPVNGGEILINYDPSCLDYVGVVEAVPYTNTVYGPVVNETVGTVFVAVGVEFGTGNGPNGNSDLVCFSFLKKGTCNSCQICPLQENPMHTYLTDDQGQRITVQANCSKPIYATSDVTLTVPGSFSTNVDCDRPTAVENWTAPSASAECGNGVQVFCRGEHEGGLVYDSTTATGGGEFPLGASSFCCYAVSDGPCGVTVGCPPNTSCVDADHNGKPDGCWTVTVNDETSLDITVGLQPGSQSNPGGTVERCIKFSLYGNCAVEPLVFSDNVTFGGLFEYIGKSTGKIKIPGIGQWSCITAQDQLHTLRSCYSFVAADCAGGQLNARFSGDPRLGGNWLVGGNLDGWKKDDPNASPSLDVIDILDWGTFVSQYLRDYIITNTPCGTAGPNADINGDGVVDLDDYAFISANFLVSSKNCCCGPQTASATAVTEISVSQLRAAGLTDLISADLNGDGMLNLADMAAFDQGVRPTTKAPTKGGSRTGSR